MTVIQYDGLGRHPLAAKSGALLLGLLSDRDLSRLVLDHLGPADRVLLSLTCHDLYERLQSPATDGSTTTMTTTVSTLRSRLNRLDFLAFLSAVARDLRDQYACELCLGLHRAGPRDGHALDCKELAQASAEKRTMKPGLQPPCCRDGRAARRMATVMLTTTKGHPKAPAARRTMLASICHRDVQLTLKRARLLKEARHLQLQPLSRPLSTTKAALSAIWKAVSRIRPNLGIAQSNASTLLAGDLQPLQSMVQQALGPFETTRTTVTTVWLSHYKSQYDDTYRYKFAPRIVAGPDGHPRANEELSEVQSTDDQQDTYYSSNIRTYAEASSCCARCPTDFHLRVQEDDTTITVWQDFGPEGQVSDLIWQSHILGPFFQAETGEELYALPNTWESGPTVTHSPGSVRELYESSADWTMEPATGTTPRSRGTINERKRKD
ncbi:hypothetical protein CMQ_6320 [Grosmannia clavigera kw1407]|uniref:F-box domain containing protein n=1 Tax=Grosmannia clavigera (strain kw1407 / UAMH 11150) TaxID=655863 RepID=F0XLE5_GROCL|nr:uncharacterized protein CMQ_6320 [Grosmannia clavigera kw1407]EFX01378.1 hypothetical protein CMQ_6320 [Grosmannia clavigera kw1407]